MRKTIMGAKTRKIAALDLSSISLASDGKFTNLNRFKLLPAIKKSSLAHLRRIATSFILFDWEFFSNELEYE